MVERVAFKGRMPSDLAKLGMDEYLKMIKSRQRRTIRRSGLDFRRLIEKVERIRKAGGQKVIKTHVREAVILPSWIGLKFGVHNGKEFHEMLITANMLGHRLGEFAYTTKKVQHSAPGIRATRGSKFLAVK